MQSGAKEVPMNSDPSSGYSAGAEPSRIRNDQGGFERDTLAPGKQSMTHAHAPAKQNSHAEDDGRTGGTPPGDVGQAAVQVESLLRTILRQLLADAQQPQLPFNGRLAVDEKEAAGLLGLNAWQLRDLRTSGKISHHRIVGGRVRYTLDDLQAYLDSGHQRATG